MPGRDHGARQKGGSGLGRNPTDRGKPGAKIHLLTDARGVPLLARCGPANRHDSIGFAGMLDAVPGIRTPAGRRRRRPGKLHADKGYDIPRCHAALRQRRIGDRIARIGVEPKDRLGRHRWVVEQTAANLKKLRRLAVRHEELYQAFVTLGCCVLCLYHLPRSDGL